jgi:preprotein translocase subunit YajC
MTTESIFSMNPETLGKVYTSLSSALPMIMMIGAFYFIMILPQRKKAAQQQEFLNGLKKDDRIVTNSGILGVIERIVDKEVRLTIANGVTISIEKSQIFRLQGNPSGASQSPHSGGQQAAPAQSASNDVTGTN